MPQISIIVPVYKTEKYLTRCIDSILNQTFNDYELLLIDDGSPDNCPVICDKYAELDSRIRVIHKKNAGVAAARNSGLDLADGEYVAFVDSDDYIEPEMYQSMMAIARKYNCDVVMCDCVKDFGDRSELFTHNIRPGFYNYEQLQQEYYPHLLMTENVEYPPTISNWLCLWRRCPQASMTEKEELKQDSKLQERNEARLRYVEGVRYSEDLLFGAQMIYQAKSFYYMKGETYYHYCMNPTSATHTFTADKWEDYLKLHSEAEKYFLNMQGYDFKNQIDLMLLFFVYNAVGDIRKTGLVSKHEKKKLISNILREKNVREMFKRISVHQLQISWKLKIYTFFYKYMIGINLLLLKG